MKLEFSMNAFAEVTRIRRHDDRILLRIGKAEPRHSKMIVLTLDEAAQLADALGQTATEA